MPTFSKYQNIKFQLSIMAKQKKKSEKSLAKMSANALKEWNEKQVQKQKDKVKKDAELKKAKENLKKSK